MMEASSELNRYLDRSARPFSVALARLARAFFVDRQDYERALNALAEIIGDTMILSELNGRRRMLLESDSVRRKYGHFAAVEETQESNHVHFEEAVDDLVSREPRLAKTAIEVSRLYRSEHVFAMARSASQKLTGRIQGIVSRLISGPDAASKTENEIMEAALEESNEFTRAYAATVYRTNVATAYSRGRIEQAKDPEVSVVIPALEFVSVMDARTRPNHAAANGLVAAADDPIWEAMKPPLGYQCFPAGTRISGSVIGGLKTFYSGELIQIETNNGARLSVTVNHPILTYDGWKPAQDLREGDYLLSHRSEVELLDGTPLDVPYISPSSGTINNENIPTRIEDVFESFRVRRAGSPIPLLPMLPLDLHGDAKWTDGNIDVVGSYGELFNNVVKEKAKIARQLHFPHSSNSSIARYGSGNFLPSFNGSGMSSIRVPRGSALPFNHDSIISPLLSNRPLRLLRIGPASRLNIASDEEARYSGSADPVFVSQLLNADSGNISLDKISRIRRLPYSGHVYDLQSETGWILSNGIVTSNCRCALNFVSIYDLERRGLLRDGRAVRYEPPGFSSAHPDGPPFGTGMR